MTQARLDALAFWHAQIGKPYLWAGKGQGLTHHQLQQHQCPAEGWDCSGHATAGFFVGTKGRVDWRVTHNAQALWDQLPHTKAPKAGDLAAYWDKTGTRIVHVVVLTADDPAGKVISASKGGPQITSVAIALAKGASVMYRQGHLYRPGFAGFLSSTPLDQ